MTKIPGAAATQRSQSEPPTKPRKKKGGGGGLPGDPTLTVAAAMPVQPKGKGKDGSKGKSKGKSKGGTASGCYTCGGDHFARDCPKGQQKGKGKGKGKGPPAAALHSDYIYQTAQATPAWQRTPQQQKMVAGDKLGCFQFRDGNCTWGDQCRFQIGESVLHVMGRPRVRAESEIL